MSYEVKTQLKRVISVLTLIALMLLCGCTQTPMDGHVPTSVPGLPTYYAVPPVRSAAPDNRTEVTLYFAYGGTGLLSTERRSVATGSASSIEECVINALAEGPSAEYSELRALLPAGTRVMSIEEHDGILFVTLSNEFLSVPSDAPEDWESDDYWSQLVLSRRRLAVQSIVCALTDIGNHSSMQLLIDRDNEGEKKGERVERYYFYPDPEKNSSVMLDVVHRNEDLVLTPRNTVKTVLTRLQAQNYTGVYSFVRQDDNDTRQRTADELGAELQKLEYAVTDFAIGDCMVTNDGQQATVCVSATLTNGDGTAVQLEKFPIKLAREREIWRVSYSSLTALLED